MTPIFSKPAAQFSLFDPHKKEFTAPSFRKFLAPKRRTYLRIFQGVLTYFLALPFAFYLSF